MTAICITGASRASLDNVLSMMRIHGVAPCASLPSRGDLDLLKWHDRVAELNKRQAGPVSTGGRLWEELAIDLLVANLEQPVWAWAHTFSLELLDFWRQLDSQVRFLLVCEPRMSLAKGLVQGSALPPGVSLEEALKEPLTQWSRAHQTMLRFHLRHPEISQMVWAPQADGSIHQLTEQMNRQWGLGLRVDRTDQAGDEPAPATTQATRNALLDFLATELLQGGTESQALEQELFSTLGEPAAGAALAPPTSTLELVGCYQSMADRSALDQAQADLQAKLAVETQAKAVAESALEKAKQAQATLSAELSAERETHGQKLKETQEENELLLAQLHQVQEELEKYFLQDQEKSNELQTRAKELAEIRAKLVAEGKAKAELQAKLEAEVKAKTNAQAAKDSEAKAKSEMQAKLTAETQAKAVAESALEKAKQAQATLSAELSAERETHGQKLKETQEENELLLAQLHQVQEELEKYFLMHQEVQLQLQKLNDRWGRAVQAHPVLQKFEAVELLSEDPAQNCQIWQINQMEVGGQVLAPFVCKTFLEDGVLGVNFERQNGRHLPLKQWPQSVARSEVLTLIPIKGQTDGKQRAASLLQLCASDWYMLHQLLSTLKEALASGHCVPQRVRAAELLLGIEGHTQRLRNIPDMVRFDGAQLLGQRSTPKMNVLALQVHSAWFHDAPLGEITFQVQLNTLSAPGLHSAWLIVEPPEQSGIPFETWAPTRTSTADKPVMSLELGAQGWTGEAWSSLSHTDRRLTQALLNTLPLLWARMQGQGIRLEGGWTAWVEAATQMRNWAKATTMKAGVTAAPRRSSKKAVKPKIDHPKSSAKKAVAKKAVAKKAAVKKTAPSDSAKPAAPTGARAAVKSPAKQKPIKK